MASGTMLGRFTHSLDNKNRLFFPAKFREELGDTFYITRKIKSCLAAYSEDEWERITSKINASPDSLVGPLKEFLYTEAIHAEPDSNGRVLLTPNLIRYAGIDKSVVIVGVGDHIQLWSEDGWAAEEKTHDAAALLAISASIGI